jgi:hypothetical protein
MGQRSRDDKPEPSLELPSLPGLGRRKKSRRDRRAAAPAAAAAPEQSEPQSPGPPTPHPEEHAEPTQALPQVTSAFTADTRAEERDAGERDAGVPDVEDGYAAGPDAGGSAQDDPTLRLSENGLSENGAPRRRAEKRQRPERAQGPESRKTREPRATPLVPGRLAALLTGIAVGAAGAAGTYGAMAGCKAVRGVSTCGGAPGFFILVAILVLMVLLGAGLLSLLRVSDAGSTSFLAVGLVAVVAMLFLLEVIFSVWMFAVIPAVSGVAFLVAHWVTTRFADEDKGRRDWT